MKNFDKLANLASMVYMASVIKEVSGGNIKEEYIYTYPSTGDEKLIVTADRVKYSALDWSISFFNDRGNITIVNSQFYDFKRVAKIFIYVLGLLLEQSSEQLLNNNHA